MGLGLMMGPPMVDQVIREAIEQCWLALPKQERFSKRSHPLQFVLIGNCLRDYTQKGGSPRGKAARRVMPAPLGGKREENVTSQTISLRSVEIFVSSSLPGKLKNDLRTLKIIKEGDLECCAYHHLRRFLRRDPTWNVFSRRHSLHTGYYIDLVLFRRGYPRIAIELKWDRSRISQKDRRSLQRSIRSLRVNRAYFITTLIGANKPYTKIQKTSVEKNRLFEIVIRLRLNGADLESWKNRRRAFTSKMVRGKARS
jgi:hypothetical protein